MMSKSENTIKLSIGIPVFNGERFIEDTINSIKFLKGNEDKIEVLVSDNCSTDNTEEIVKKFPFIKYYKNETNVGYDRNVHNVFLKATGDFVWTIAADDVIVNESDIDEIINILELNEDCALINVAGNGNLINKYNHYNGEEFFIGSKFQSGGVSSNIIKRESWLNSNPSDFFDSEWIHFGVVINLVSISKSIVTKEKFIEENILSVSMNKSWNVGGSSLAVMIKLSVLFNKMKHLNYSKVMQNNAKLVIKGDYPRAIIKARANGLVVSKQLILDFIACYYSFFSFWVIDLPFLLSPKWFCEFIYNKRNVFTESQ